MCTTTQNIIGMKDLTRFQNLANRGEVEECFNYNFQLVLVIVKNNVPIKNLTRLSKSSGGEDLTNLRKAYMYLRNRQLKTRERLIDEDIAMA